MYDHGWVAGIASQGILSRGRLDTVKTLEHTRHPSSIQNNAVVTVYNHVIQG